MKSSLRLGPLATLSMLASLILLTLVILACGDDATDTPGATATTAPGQTRTPGATAAPTNTPTATTTAGKVPVQPRLRVAIPPPQYLSVAAFDDVEGVIAYGEHLVGVDRNTGFEDKSGLAEDWSMSTDGKTWNFKLRQGIPFHTAPEFNGAELKSKDAIHTLQVLGSDVSNRPEIWRNFGVEDSNFQVVDDHEFNWLINAPSAAISAWLNPQQHASIQSKDYWDLKGEQGFLAHPVGTGSWQFVQVNQNVNLLYERVDEHWRKVPEFHELEYVFIPEDSTRMASLLAKEVSISDVPRILLPEVTQKGFAVTTGTLPGFTVFVFIGGQYYDGPRTYLAGPKKGETEPVAPGYDPDDPLRNVDVRKAINLSLDRTTIAETFWKGSYIMQQMFSITPSHPHHKSEWAVYPYDVDQAKQILAQAGYPDGITLDFWFGQVAGVPEIPEMAEVFAQQWAQAGINLNLTETEFANIRAKYRARDIGKFMYPVRYAITSFQSSTCFPMSNVAGGCGSPQWEYDELDQIFINLQNAVTDEDIERYTHQMGDFLYNNYIFVPGWYLLPQAAYDPGVIADPGFRRYMMDQGPTEGLEYTVPMYQ